MSSVVAEPSTKETGASEVALSPSNIIVDFGDIIYTVHNSIQADLGNKINFLQGVDRQCHVCGIDYEFENKVQQSKWIGYDEEDCKYWLHASCLLGKSKKITHCLYQNFLTNVPLIGRLILPFCHRQRP